MMFTEFCKNSKVVSSDFSMMKNNVASSSSSLPIKLIFCFKSAFSNSICLLNLLQLVYNALRNIHNPINHQLCYHLLISIILSYAFLLSFTGTSKKPFPSINTLKSFIVQFLVYKTLKKMFYYLHFQMIRQIIDWLY